VQMSPGVEGAHIATLRLKDSMGNIGLAITEDGAVMAISNYLTRMITLYSLPGGEVLRVFGGKGSRPGQFCDPRKLCFTVDCNLLVAEDENKRLQEVTMTGQHVRFVGVDTFVGAVAGVASNSEFIVANQACDSNRIVVFDFRTGAFVRSFGDRGSDPGQLNGNACLRISPDGSHIIVAEAENNRVSVFTVRGEFVRCWGDSSTLNNPVDLCFTECGDVAVTNNYGHNVVVFSRDGKRVVTAFGTKGAEAGKFQYPCALTVCCGKLYVLDFWSDRVQVFE
jgi:WD40 repeat protein